MTYLKNSFNNHPLLQILVGLTGLLSLGFIAGGIAGQDGFVVIGVLMLVVASLGQLATFADLEEWRPETSDPSVVSRFSR